MNAILALSARQLSRITDFDPYVADAYYQRCFETLIPALNDNVAIHDESLLAATVILRLMEEMNSMSYTYPFQLFVTNEISFDHWI